MTMVIKICQQCNNEFNVKPYMKDKARYCSHLCYWKSKIGYKQSKETIKKRTFALIGHIVSSDTRKKIGDSNRGKISWLKGKRFGIIKNCLFCKNSFYVPQSNKNKKFCSYLCYWKNKIGKTSWNKGIPWTEEHKQKLKISRRFQVFPTRDTSIEVKIQNLLRENNIEFETHYPILGQPDLFIKPNIAIFCDGDYWHNLPGAKEKDERITKTLQSQNYIVIRLWEHQINKEIKNCYYKIKEKVALAT